VVERDVEGVGPALRAGDQIGSARAVGGDFVAAQLLLIAAVVDEAVAVGRALGAGGAGIGPVEIAEPRDLADGGVVDIAPIGAAGEHDSHASHSPKSIQTGIIPHSCRLRSPSVQLWPDYCKETVN